MGASSGISLSILCEEAQLRACVILSVYAQCMCLKMPYGYPAIQQILFILCIDKISVSTPQIQNFKIVKTQTTKTKIQFFLLSSFFFI